MVVIDYTNWKGARRKRPIKVISVTLCTAPPYHPELQWIAHAIDLEDGVRKTFPLNKIHSWEEVK